ncbi:hypothetical protein BZB76_1433 [Actinomadura pelletieri DSM 43383]|uniref:Uncharacterized protein n=1 Tax=Actinomadura pelletieri DSM 43383 TaxID=1120940 RepID=A0A495QRG4_9ACTN|nr:hypothetical protein [Actinomadura pelletieri]RKS76084.1 hypothetical protein BZB76_1433 [Actinomadura pelletieri DSM 43383]
MAVNYIVSVGDVNGRPLPAARVRLGPATGLTDPAGRFTASLDLDPAQQVTLEVDDAHHVPERCVFLGLPGSSDWDNALVAPTRSGADVLLAVTLGRMDTSPTRNLSAEERAALMKTRGRDPGGALLFDVPRFAGIRGYDGHWNDKHAMHVPRRQLLPSTPVAPGTPGWGRFQSDMADADPAAFGRFFWLEYPARPSRPRWVVAVWSPNLPDEKPPASLDYIVFYSPHTQKSNFAEVTYPYGLAKDGPSQTYLDLAKRYMLDTYYFVYSMIAQRSRAVLVMPISDFGDLGPFTRGEGLYRALREVGLFLHRQCRTSRLGLRPPRPPNVLELAGPNLRVNTPSIAADSFGPVPTVGKVAVGGFSTGISPVKGLMPESGFTVSTRNTPFDSSLWGVPPGGGTIPLSSWRNSWHELWDLDGFHPDTGGWPAYLDLLLRWARENEARAVRTYHSSDRVPPDPLTHPHKVWKYLTGSGLDVKVTLPAVAGIGRAQQLQNARWTSVTMDETYQRDGAHERPPLIDAATDPRHPDTHHTSPRVAFPLFLQLTTLGRPPRP